MSPGTTVIRARFGGKGDSSRVTVTGAQLGSITIAPASLSLLVGQTVRLSVVARDSDGNPTITKSMTWTSDDATVAVISASGMLYALRKGR